MSDSPVAGPAGKPKRSRRNRAPESGTTAVAEPVKERAVGASMTLDAELGIDQVTTLRSQLAQRLNDVSTVVLDGADVQRIHTAAMQLFCLFCGDRRNAGRDTRWHRPSPALRSAAALLGVTTLLQIAREPA